VCETAAVHCKEGTASPRTAIVYGLGYQLLTCTAVTSDQDSALFVSYKTDLLEEIKDRFGFTNNTLDTESVTDLLSEVDILLFDLLLTDGLLDGYKKLIYFEGLDEVI